ncbi:MAG: polymerase subunit gamma and tau, partial [Agromyces sp.]|nr:polymerase subunit gamma and tau [Agromyces sp.]
SPAPTRPKPVGPVTLQLIRDAWPEILGVLERTKRTAWMAAMTAKVIDYRDDDVLILGFPSQNDVNDLRGTGVQSPAELLRRAIADVLGVQVKFLPRVIGSQTAETGPAAPVQHDAPPASGTAPAPERARVPEQPPSPAPSTSAQAPAVPAASAPAGPTSSPSPAAPVDSWATAAIPTDEPDVAVAPAGSSVPRDPSAAAPRLEPRATATALAEPPASAPEPVGVPDDTEAPPEDIEPPFDPGPPPEIVVDVAPAVAPGGGIQRYGEAVVREVLGATFLEEVEAPGRTGFGERG